jgi:hypothetical protein
LDTPEISVEKLCNSTYRWFCQWDAMGLNDEWDLGSGYLTMDLKPGGTPSPENIFGTIRIWEQRGTFASMVKHQSPNSWDFTNVTWDEDEGMDESEEYDHGISIIDVKDDEGHAFLLFNFNEGYSGCIQSFASFVGKRQKDKESYEGLTDAEKDRLGMLITWDEAEKLAAAKAPEEEAKDEVIPSVDLSSVLSSFIGKRKAEDEEVETQNKLVRPKT